MERNPYAPPSARVDDQSGRDRPKSVKIAIVLLVCEVALGVSTFLLPSEINEYAIEMTIGLGFLAAFLAASIWLIFGVWRGRNWARFGVAIYALVTLLTLEDVPDGMAFLPVGLLIDLAVVALDVVALILLFGPGRRWFRK